jgi:hypothetical protein
MSASTAPTPAAVPPNRAGLREGQVSELTVIVPLKEGGAARLSAILAAQRGRLGATAPVPIRHGDQGAWGHRKQGAPRR